MQLVSTLHHLFTTAQILIIHAPDSDIGLYCCWFLQ